MRVNLKPPFKTTTSVTRHGPSACSRFEAFLRPSTSFVPYISSARLDRANRLLWERHMLPRGARLSPKPGTSPQPRNALRASRRDPDYSSKLLEP